MAETHTKWRLRASVRPDGQALAEFALVFGVFFLLVGAVIQFGLLLWSMNTVTQVARDTARWAATQSASPCNSTTNLTRIASKADGLARQLVLLGYQGGTWSSASLGINTVGSEGVAADWPIPTDAGITLFDNDCPPSDASVAWFVRVRVNHVIPIFMPGLQLLLPSCGSSGFCLSSTAEIRMEPRAP